MNIPAYKPSLPHVLWFFLLIGFSLLLPLGASADTVRLLETPEDAWLSRVNLIEQADETIEMEYYTFSDDEISLVFYGLVLEAADRGVEIRIIGDALLNGIPDGVMSAFVDHENIDVRLFQPIRKIYAPTHWNKHLHDKALLIDGEELIAGGRNINNRFYGIGDVELTRDRDIYVKAEGESEGLRAYRKYFNDLWGSYQIGKSAVEVQQTYECPNIFLALPCKLVQRDLKKKQAASLKEIGSFMNKMRRQNSLMFDTGYDWSSENAVTDAKVWLTRDVIGDKHEDNGTSLALREAFQNAEESIIGQSPYVIPTKKMMSTYRNLKDKKIPFTIMTNSVFTSPNVTSIAATDHSKPALLREAGIDLWEFQDEWSSVHQKSFVIDDRLSIVGSYNLDPRSAYTNTELLFFIESEEFAKVLKDTMESYKAMSLQLDESGDPILREGGPPAGEVSFLKTVFVEILSFLAPLYKWAT